MTIAFYAPLKPPDDPVPSGERAMARALIAALDGAGASYRPELVSRLMSRDGEGAADAQARLFAAAALEEERLVASLAERPPSAWLTYHNYYKAPDLLGPALSRRLGIPYLIVEASRSPKRRDGPWASFAAAADHATLSADAVFYMTERDRPALADARPKTQRLERLRPFLARETAPPPRIDRPERSPLRLIAVGMLRAGDKLSSYRALSTALSRCVCDWTLDVVGDGPAESDVRAAFADAGDRVRFRGRLDADGVEAALREADAFVWPGVGEAFGIAYLEAQAVGLPVVAEDRPGVRDVARDGAVLTPVGDAEGFAAAVDALAAAPARRASLGAAGRDQVDAEHLLGGARETLTRVIADLTAATQS